MFENTTTMLESVKAAQQLILDLRSIYQSSKLVQIKLALYQAGTDAVFNAAINALFNASERNDLSNMLTDINTLVTHWEANHKAALGIE